MFESIRCRLKGHLYVDSKSTPGTQVCVRCRHRMPFEGLAARADHADPSPDAGPESRPAGSAPPPRR
jgi:hypothetical protein